METGSLTRFWPVVYALVREFWDITERDVGDAALREEIPLDLYYYSELGLDIFSREEFQKRDPFTNPEQFERLFARLDVKGWIAPIPDGRYEVTDWAREGVRRIIHAGDEQLSRFESVCDVNLERLVLLLRQIVEENKLAPEPPQKWAILKRFRVADGESPMIVRAREYLMDLFAYHDDSHLSAARPHFGQAGIVWSVLDSIWSGEAVTAEKMSETMAVRGYDVEDYEVAIKASIEIGWVETAELPETFRLTQTGRELREQVEQLTDEYFFHSWSVVMLDETDELYDLLVNLLDQLRSFRAAN
jgi:hypothetical protein